MARILLGVSGGIAAYKALEVVRLATKAGHVVRVVQTPDSQRFVGAASFAALSGAPVLTSEFERDPARGAFPDQPAPEHDPLSHLELVRNADVFLIAPGDGEHDREVGAWPRRQPAHERRACVNVSACDRSGDEPPHVGARRDPGERRDAARARGAHRRPGRGRARQQERVGQRPAGRARRAAGRRRGRRAGRLPALGRPARARDRRRHPRADRRGPLRREPLVRPDGLRARRRGRRARRRRDRGRGERRAAAHAAGQLPRRRDGGRAARGLPRAPSRTATSCSWPRRSRTSRPRTRPAASSRRTGATG